MHHLISAPYDLRINRLARPFGLRRGGLSVSYITDCVSQTACRFVVSLADGCVCYDSDWQETPKSSGVTPVGLSDLLLPDRLYRMQVAVRDRDGRESPLSAPLAFTVDTNWISTEAIWAPADSHGTTSDFIFARHAFFLTAEELKGAACVLASVTAASPEPSRQFVYTLLCNGACIGVGPVRYGKTAEGEEVLYDQVYDITARLLAGENVLSAVLYALSERGFLCQVTLHRKDGTSRVLTNSGCHSGNWRVLAGDAAFGKSNSIGTHYFTAHACNVDARLFPFGFEHAGFDEAAWKIPATVGPIGGGRRLLPAECEPVGRFEFPRESMRMEKRPGGDILIDLGAEIVGNLTLHTNVPADCTITLRYGEQCTPDGVKYRMNTGNVYEETRTLTAGACRTESFSLMTYRYVQISGYPGELSPADVCGVEIRKAFDDTQSILRTEHPLLAAMHRLVKHTVRATTQDLYVDSQSRERGAYEGDLLINMLAAYAMENSYAPARLTTEYLLGHRTWPADYLLMIIFAARADYMATGDASLLTAWYGTLKENLFTSDRNEKLGLIRTAEVRASSQNAILVDWPPSERDGYDMGCAYNTVFNALHVRAYEDMAFIAEVTGHAADAAEFTDLAARLRTAMIEGLYNPASGRFCDGIGEDGTPSAHCAQHATAFALNCGIYANAAMADRMAAAMASDGRMHVSVYGAFFLLEGLYRSGNGKIANRLLLDSDIGDGARTWAYMLNRLGATITTEAWCEKNKPNMTLSHPWGAAPAHMMAGGILGIRPLSPGYAAFEVNPCTFGVGDVDLTLPTVKGQIRVAVQNRVLTVEVPGNTEAIVVLPDGTRLTVRKGTHSFPYAAT